MNNILRLLVSTKTINSEQVLINLYIKHKLHTHTYTYMSEYSAVIKNDYSKLKKPL